MESEVRTLFYTRGAVQAMVNKYGVPTLVAWRCSKGYSILHYAVLNVACGCDAAPVQAVLTALDLTSDDVNAQNVEGHTPLHHARSMLVVRCLVAAGASMSVKDRFGNNPLQHACICSPFCVVRQLISCSDDSACVLLAKNSAGDMALDILQRLDAHPLMVFTLLLQSTRRAQVHACVWRGAPCRLTRP